MHSTPPTPQASRVALAPSVRIRGLVSLFALAALTALASACDPDGTREDPIDLGATAQDGTGGATDASAPGDASAGMDSIASSADPDASLDALDSSVDSDGTLDAASDTASVDLGDGSTAMDTSTPPDMATDTADASWGPCAVSGQSGVCIDVALCDGGRVTTAGLCPGGSEIRCCHDPVMPTSCDENERVVPPGNAVLVEAAGDPGCPDGMIGIDASFCVDRYEAATLEILGNGTEVPHSPFFNPEARRIRAVSVAGAVPQGYISGTQAAAACAESGKRLCSDTEWLRACQGAAGSTYPYGDTRQGGVCNDARSPHPVVEYFGTSADWIWSELGNSCIGQQGGTVALTGEHAGCVSADGALDMMGNLHEWTSDPAGTFRGGFYVDTAINGEGCLYRTTAHSSGHWDYSTGFRCCADRL